MTSSSETAPAPAAPRASRNRAAKGVPEQPPPADEAAPGAGAGGAADVADDVADAAPAETVPSPSGADAAPVAGGAPAPHPVQLTIDAIADRVKTCMSQLKETDALMRSLMRDAKKLCKKRGSNGKPSNLTQPLGISSELADFIGVDRDAQMTRGSVTKAINEYAVREGLKLPDNGRIIRLDDKLASLLGKDRDTEIPIINVQSHLREHYVKNAPAAIAAAV